VRRRAAAPATAAGLDPAGVVEISTSLNAILAGVSAVFFKKKNVTAQVGGGRSLQPKLRDQAHGIGSQRRELLPSRREF
jgi:hypothetical protein